MVFQGSSSNRKPEHISRNKWFCFFVHHLFCSSLWGFATNVQRAIKEQLKEKREKWGANWPDLTIERGQVMTWGNNVFQLKKMHSRIPWHCGWCSCTKTKWCVLKNTFWIACSHLRQQNWFWRPTNQNKMKFTATPRLPCRHKLRESRKSDYFLQQRVLRSFFRYFPCCSLMLRLAISLIAEQLKPSQLSGWSLSHFIVELRRKDSSDRRITRNKALNTDADWQERKKHTFPCQ